MTLLGLDFDNTLVEYDEIFYQLAIDKCLINNSVAPTKIAIRDYLREKGLDSQFTLLQAEVYGPKILDARPAPGMLHALKTLCKQGISMTLISHKTEVPYAGPTYPLREYAKKWLKKNGFFCDPFRWSNETIYFASSKEEKISQISLKKCNFYVDDLPEIINQLPANIQGILYDPKKLDKTTNSTKMHYWDKLPEIINSYNE